jgi:hypothetical protein
MAQNNLDFFQESIAYLQTNQNYYFLAQKSLTNKDSLNNEKNEYIKNIAQFIATYNIEIKDNYKKQIYYNYIKFLVIFDEYYNKKNYSKNYLSNFRIFVNRLMEIILFVQNQELPELHKIIFNSDSFEFFHNLIAIFQIDSNFKKAEKILDDEKILEKSILIKSDGIFIEANGNTYQYKSLIKVQGFGDISSVYLYLRLNICKVLHKVYNLIDIKPTNSGGNVHHYEYVPLDPYDKVFNTNKVIKNIDNITLKDTPEEFYESNSRSLKILNLKKKIKVYSEKVNKYNSLVEKKFRLSTNYKDKISVLKVIKIEKAIGHYEAKNNLNLPSKYNIPVIPLLQDFLQNSYDKSLYSKLMISVLITGINLENIFTMLLSINQDFQYLTNNNIIRIKLTTKYAHAIDSNLNLTDETNKYVEIELPIFLTTILKEISKELIYKIKNKIIPESLYTKFKELSLATVTTVPIVKQNSFIPRDFKNIQEKIMNFTNVNAINEFIQENMDKDFYTKFIEGELKQFSKFFKKKKNKFTKTISVTPTSLSNIFFHYFKQAYDTSEINLLYAKTKTQNVHTKLTYVATRTNLINYSIWIEELVDKLELMKILKITIDIAAKNNSDQFSGSPKFIHADKYKTFLGLLSKLELDNQYDNVNIRMIYLRYLFSISFATREYYFSANLKSYSRREKVLFIHEKAKNIHSSKRIIPLTNTAVEYIEYFYKLRERYNIISYAPILFEDNLNETNLSSETIKSWLIKKENEIMNFYNKDVYQFLLDFVSKVDLNVGRHIFASLSNSLNIVSSDEIDAFLNHFEKGTQDQAIYSVFDNQKYFKNIRKNMEIIEKRYIPYSKFLSENINGI